MKNIHEEVRKLHYQLQGKDQIINQLKQMIQKNQHDDPTDLQEQEEELQRVLHSGQTESDDTKEYEKIIIELLQSDKMASEADLNNINFSTLIGANELRLILNARNNQLKAIEKCKANCLEQSQEIDVLR